MTQLSTLLLGSLAASASAPVVASADADGAEPAEPSMDPLAELLVVRVDVEGDQSASAALHAELVAALHEAGVVDDLSGDAPLEVFVSMDGETLGSYVVAYRHDGSLLDSWTCPCTGDELRARLRLATIQAWHAAAHVDAPVAPQPPSSVASSAPRPAMPPHERGFGAWVAGVTTVAIGTSVVTGTSALLIGDAAAGREIEPRAIGLWSGGIAMVATGAVLWGVGRHRRKLPSASVRTHGPGRSVVFVVEGRF